jgi:hypothetical protein
VFSVKDNPAFLLGGLPFIKRCEWVDCEYKFVKGLKLSRFFIAQADEYAIAVAIHRVAVFIEAHGDIVSQKGERPSKRLMAAGSVGTSVIIKL